MDNRNTNQVINYSFHLMQQKSLRQDDLACVVFEQQAIVFHFQPPIGTSR